MTSYWAARRALSILRIPSSSSTISNLYKLPSIPMPKSNLDTGGLGTAIERHPNLTRKDFSGKRFGKEQSITKRVSFVTNPLTCIPGHENHLEIRILSDQVLRQCFAIHTRHHHIRQKQMDRWRSVRDLHGFGTSLCSEHAVSKGTKYVES